MVKMLGRCDYVHIIMVSLCCTYRNATHSQVVQLLKESGPTPQLLISPSVRESKEEDYATISSSLKEKVIN